MDVKSLDPGRRFLPLLFVMQRGLPFESENLTSNINEISFLFLADLKKKKFMPLKPFAFCTNLIEWIIILPFIGIIWIEWE